MFNQKYDFVVTALLLIQLKCSLPGISLGTICALTIYTTDQRRRDGSFCHGPDEEVLSVKYLMRICESTRMRIIMYFGFVILIFF